MNNPYIGPRSFTREQRDRFFGRSREARNLLSLVISERLVLFYAQSGAGKTSLLNTSLIPSLEENERAVLPVGRVSGELPAGLDDVDNIFVFNLLTHLDQSNTDPACFARMELKDFLEHLSSADGETYAYDPAEAEEGEGSNDDADDEEMLLYVLIIDQFEEILTDHPERWQDRAGFFRQLDQAMRHDPGLFVVLTLREDYVATLESYAPFLTDRMRSRFYMERMERKAALAAVTGPAKKYGRPFAPGAAEALVDNLSLIRSARSVEPRPGQYIEPVQLQVVCFQLWRNLPPGEEITQDQVNQIGNIDHALADFYEQAVAETLQASGGSELELRQWFDRKLITEAGTRGTVFQGEEVTGGMDNRAVRLLEDRFLLRAESRAGAVWYELVHDRFVEPIQQANQKWLEQQGPLLRDALAWKDSNKTDQSLLYTGEKLAKVLAERTERNVLESVITEFLEDCQARQTWLEEKEEANQRFRKWFKVAVVVAAVAVLASLWAGWATDQARRAEKQAKGAEQAAIKSRKETEETLNRLQKTEALNTGMALNAKAALAENEGSRLYAHLYSLHALDKLGKNNKDSAAYMEAVIRAQANPVPVPAFVGYHEGISNSAVFSSDGRIVISTSNDNIHVWDTVTGKRIKSFTQDMDGVITLSPDDRTIGFSLDNKVGMLDIYTGDVFFVQESHADLIRSIAFSPDSQTLASGARDDTIKIWDIQKGQLLRTIEYNATGYDVSFSPDGRTLTAGSYDGIVNLWDVETGELLLALDGYMSAVLSIAFSHNGNILAAGSFDGVNLWNIKKRQLFQELKNDNNSLILSLSFSPSNQTLLSADFFGVMAIRDIQTGKVLQKLEGKAAGRNATFSPDGQTVLSSWKIDEGNIGLWGADASRLRTLKGHTGPVKGISFSSDGGTVTTISRDKTIGIWELSSGRRLQNISLQKTKGSITSAAFSPGGNVLAVNSLTSNNIGLLEVSTGKHLRNLEGHTNSEGSIAFSPDGKTIASGGFDNSVRIWDTATGHCRGVLKNNGEGIYSISNIAFSPDGLTLSFSVLDSHSFWDVSTDKRLQTLENTQGGMSFSPDGHTIASGSDDYSLGIWDIVTGKRLQTLEGHTAYVSRVIFSPDGRLLASSSMDKTIAIWDVKTGKRIRTLKENNIASESIIAFSPDGKTLAFTTDDNAIGLWDLGDNPNEFSGISLDEKGEYKIDLNTLPYKLEGLELQPIEEKQPGPNKSAHWSRYHPFHWLPAAEKGDSNAMLQIGIIYDRNNDITRALRWYGKAIKAGNEQARKQQGILLHWLEDKENWQTVPGPFRTTFCKAKAEFELPSSVLTYCTTQEEEHP
ncbi:MAG: WD40 repeat domain-containing protein [Candidatus Electrothrix aestuarii]|uniref:WD40 repeat domain-containing protein n=1 Tax=Candidatus Electrothrix aestuarii TaxID=3062594 RepID=A0AAU8M1Q8_9BACT|nr:WD40 repeat domain-containing protein [Candidatus Electrothrix aestuarii]